MFQINSNNQFTLRVLHFLIILHAGRERKETHLLLKKPRHDLIPSLLAFMCFDLVRLCVSQDRSYRKHPNYRKQLCSLYSFP